MWASFYKWLFGRGLLVLLGLSPCSGHAVPVGLDMVYNARLAARQGDTALADGLKLTFLYQRLRSDQKTSDWDADVLSLRWFLADQLDLCSRDLIQDGAGIHHLVRHNALVAGRGRMGRRLSKSQVGRLKRHVFFDSFLADGEIENLALASGGCPRVAGQRRPSDVVQAKSLRALLARFVDEGPGNQIRGMELARNRIKLIDLYLLRQGHSADSQIRVLDYVERPAAFWVSMPSNNQWIIAGEIQKRVSAEDFIAFVANTVDGLLAAGHVKVAQDWLGLLPEPARRRIWDGSLGDRFLRMDPTLSTSYVALHRAIAHLDKGALTVGLNYLGTALKHQASSYRPQEIADVAAEVLKQYGERFRFDRRLLRVMDRFLSKHQRSSVLYHLVWVSYLLGDRQSLAFLRREKIASQLTGRRQRLVAMLDQLFYRPAALDDASKFLLRAFAADYVTFLSRSDLLIHRAHLAKTQRLIRLMRQLSETKSNVELVDKLIGLATLWQRSVSDGQRLDAVDPRGRISLGGSSLGGSVVVPWPYPKVVVSEPQIFTPIVYQPWEWVDGKEASKAIVLGWQIKG